MKGDLGEKIKRYQLEHLVPLTISILSIFFWISYFSYTLVYLIGLIINSLGLIIWWCAKITIGQNWDAGYGKPKIKKLVTKGIYSKLGHPLYWGINLTLIGLCLVHLNIYLILLSVLIIFYFFYRMKIETEFLTKKIGKKYEDYRSKTWI